MAARLEVDQRAGDLTLHTARAGIGSLVGHDLTLRIGSWSASATLVDGDAVDDVRVVANVRTLEVVRADGGLKPLTAHDRAHILANAMVAMRAKTESRAVFEAPPMRLDLTSGRVSGRLSLAGVSRPHALDVEVVREGPRMRVWARGELLQTDFGIQPYVGMFGALKVRDRVEVRAAFTVVVPEYGP